MNRRLVVVLVFVLGPLLAGALQPAPVRYMPVSRSERTVWDSVFTAEQATRGQTSYVQTCARCHRASLAGADESPALTGSGFLGNWNGLPLGTLFERIRTTMPTDTPGTYNRPLIADVMAYVLKANGFPSGAVELSNDTAALKGILLQATKP